MKATLLTLLTSFKEDAGIVLYLGFGLLFGYVSEIVRVRFLNELGDTISYPFTISILCGSLVVIATLPIVVVLRSRSLRIMRAETKPEHLVHTERIAVYVFFLIVAVSLVPFALLRGVLEGIHVAYFAVLALIVTGNTYLRLIFRPIAFNSTVYEVEALKLEHAQASRILTASPPPVILLLGATGALGNLPLPLAETWHTHWITHFEVARIILMLVYEGIGYVLWFAFFLTRRCAQIRLQIRDIASMEMAKTQKGRAL